MKCKFCGCTEEGGCSIAIRVNEDDSAFVETGIIEQFDPDIDYIPCQWIAPNVCSAPTCVEKAYAEAELLADQLQFFLGRSA